MFKLMDKEINAILGAQTIFIWTYAVSANSIYFILNACMILTFSGSIFLDPFCRLMPFYEPISYNAGMLVLT